MAVERMDRKPVASSNIKSIAYNEEQRVLEIEFVRGGIYAYSNVPKDVYESLKNAPSTGKYFIKYIKEIFACKRVK